MTDSTNITLKIRVMPQDGSLSRLSVQHGGEMLANMEVGLVPFDLTFQNPLTKNPVAWQYRIFWEDPDDARGWGGWGNWQPCTKDEHDAYAKMPKHSVRTLFAFPDSAE